MNRRRLLHITAHLGGGVGKVLSRLAAESARRGDGWTHVIACLEAPEKSQFVDHAQAHGAEVLVCPDPATLAARIAAADIVQLEWWHHPKVAAWMGGDPWPAMRLVVWSHVSGLSPPEIPPEFAALPHRFLFTSPCSWEHPRLAALDGETRRRIDAVFSSGGFDDLPPPPRRDPQAPVKVGYIGTLNYAKLHPDLLDYLAAVRLPGFRLSMVGDPVTADGLMAEAKARGLAGRLHPLGYSTQVVEQLAAFDLLAYPLNPRHYGTTENALLEAMAMGVVPVVLDNPAERHLVRQGETGLIVDSPRAFADAIQYLAENPDERQRLSANAARAIRQDFAVGRTADRLHAHYQALLAEPKRGFDFKAVFGAEPADWFRACQGGEAWRFPDGATAEPLPPGPHCLYERTKSSVFHYRDCFPQDARLARWAGRLEASR